MDARDKDSAVVLPYLVGGPLAATEVYPQVRYGLIAPEQRVRQPVPDRRPAAASVYRTR